MSIFYQLIFSIIGIIAIILTVRIIFKMKKINDRFNKAVILIPLYKKNYHLIVFMFIDLVLIAGDIYALIAFKETIFYITIGIILACCLIITILKLNFKCGILNVGIIVPFRFMDYTCKFEYILEKDTIVFFKDKNGYDIISSVTTHLRYDKNNLEKLKYILKGHESK